MSLPVLLKEIRNCTVCAAHLPLGPRPVVRAQSSAKILIIGQAPGTRVHESGVPWDDRSGDRLRDWLQIDPEVFYDDSKIAIVPMGFCYPGVIGETRIGGETPIGGGAGDGSMATKGGKRNAGDAPPRPECAPLWHDQLLAHLPNTQLTLLIGQYAQKRYLGKSRGKTLTETVARFADYMPDGNLPLPHPSWRTTGWQKKNTWFDEDLLPVLRQRVSSLLSF